MVLTVEQGGQSNRRASARFFRTCRWDLETPCTGSLGGTGIATPPALGLSSVEGAAGFPLDLDIGALTLRRRSDPLLGEQVIIR